MTTDQPHATHVAKRLFWLSQLLFIGVLVLQFGTYNVAPYQTVHPLLPVWVALALFQGIFMLCAWLPLKHLTTRKPSIAPQISASQDPARALLPLAVISLIGVLCHGYSKYYLTHIRAISCVSEIRFAWLEVSHDALPLYVQIASIAGHLLSSLTYFGVFLSCLHLTLPPTPEDRRRRYFFYLCGFILLGAIYAGFMTSRNCMLAYLIVASAGVLLGLAAAPRPWWHAGQAAVKSLTIPLVVFLAFSSFVFSDRMNCNGVDEGYFRSNCAAFSLNCEAPDAVNPAMRILWHDCETCSSFMLYFNHGIINFSQLYANSERGDPVLLAFLQAALNRLRLETNASDHHERIYGAGGTTLAGAAYHDYGWRGIIACAAVLGLLYGVFISLISASHGRSMLALSGYLIIFYVIAISSLFVGMNVLPFPFICFSCLLSYVMLRLRKDPPHAFHH